MRCPEMWVIFDVGMAWGVGLSAFGTDEGFDQCLQLLPRARIPVPHGLVPLSLIEHDRLF